MLPLSKQFLAQNYFNYLVEKLRLQNNLADEFIRIEECLKLLLLLPHSKGTIAASHAIDEVWHWMILETKQYFKLCEKLPTKEYIHHRSVVFDFIERKSNGVVIDETSPQARKKDLTEKIEWLVSYRKNFGPFTEQTLKYWPLVGELMRDKNLDLAQVNELLVSR